MGKATREELESIESIGPKIADSIIAFFGNEENRKIIKKLKAAGVLPEPVKAEEKKLPLAGWSLL
jgi:DNA ligase (NAD+)